MSPHVAVAGATPVTSSSMKANEDTLESVTKEAAGSSNSTLNVVDDKRRAPPMSAAQLATSRMGRHDS